MASIVKHAPLHVQVEGYVRNRIVSGELAPGSRLPSTVVLAKETGTSVFTVQRALARLSAEGLLDRKARMATYVRGTAPLMTSAAIYFSRSFFAPEMGFYQAIARELEGKLAARGVKTAIWTDDRRDGERTEMLPTLRRAIERREIQALIAPLANAEDWKWLANAQVPFAALTDRPIKNCTFTDLAQTMRDGFDELRAQGCRSLGVISNLHPPGGLVLEAYDALIQAANDAGLEVRNEWMRFPKVEQRHLAMYGYREFHALWDLERRPDGLLVYPDTVVSGVITAILERRVNAPEEVKLVFHANDLLPYPCPIPATFLVTEVGRLADELIEIVTAQLEQRKYSPIHPCASVISSLSAGVLNFPDPSDHRTRIADS